MCVFVAEKTTQNSANATFKIISYPGSSCNSNQSNNQAKNKTNKPQVTGFAGSCVTCKKLFPSFSPLK